MKRTNLTLLQVGLIAATRGMLGAGIGLLASSKLGKDKRKAIGAPLVAIGALSTIPLMMKAAKHLQG